MDKKEFQALVQAGITQYERDFKEMNIILVEEVLELLTSLDRSIS